MPIRVLGAFVGLLLLAPAVAHGAPTADVTRAVERGVSYLKNSQTPEGTWFYSGSGPGGGQLNHPVGVAALGGLALLESGVPSNDPVVRRAALVVRYGLADLTETYDLSLALMFLDRLGDPADNPMVDAAARRIIAGQNGDGGWTYTCPIIGGESEVHKLRSMAEKKIKASSDIVNDPKQYGVLNNNQMERPWRHIRVDDNSNTQFAIFALWVARRHHIRVDTPLAAVERRFRNSQNADGGWGYQLRMMTSSTASMTCAGLLGLGIGRGVAVLRSPSAARGGKTNDFGKDPVVRRGLLFLGNVLQPALDIGDQNNGEAMVPQPPPVGGGRGRRGGGGGGMMFRGSILGNAAGSEYYFLWSLERVAVVYSLQTIGNRDWFALGSDYLLDHQEANGSWQGNGGPSVDTCFALFFLRRANLAADLTVTLKGNITDPGVVSLKSANPSKSSKEAAKPGDKADAGTAKAEPAPAPDKSPAPAEPAVKTPAAPTKSDAASPAPAKPEMDERAREVARNRDLLVSAGPNRQAYMLDFLREGKGSVYTDALATAIPQLSGPVKEKARDALAERLTRMTNATLQAMLTDDDAEIRSAAALACAMKDEKRLVPSLIPLLKDKEDRVWRAAHTALKSLSQKDFGPASGASAADRVQAIKSWYDWWDKAGLP